MSIARKYQIDLENTPYYHCISRCVRQAFLCGKDQQSGKNFDHRKQWIVDRLSQLASTFAIDVCAFSIMSSHYHLILKIDAEKAKNWTKDEVIRRWGQIFKGDLITQLYLKGSPLSESETQFLYRKAEIWREHLSNISWFMRCLNQPIAQMANKEDGCKGRFWAGRFKSQALLDKQALLAAMVYVDLNPIRAGICNKLEHSEFTSVAQRLRELVQTKTKDGVSNYASLKPIFNSEDNNQTMVSLAPFIGSSTTQVEIPYTLKDYFELVDWTGRAIRPDKMGYIPETEPKILEKLGISSNTWFETVDNFNDNFYIFIGPKEILANISKKLNKNWLTGISPCRRLFNHLNPLSS